MSTAVQAPAADRFPTPVRLHWGRLLAQLGCEVRRRGHLPAARRVLERALALDPHNDQAHLALSAVCRQQGDLKTAVRHATEAVRGAPDQWQRLVHLAQVLGEAGLFDQKTRLLERLLAVPPARDWALAERSLLDLKRGDAQAAYDRLAARLAQGPTRVANLAAAFGRACVAVGRGQEGIAPIRHCLGHVERGTPAYPFLLHALGDCLDAAGQAEAAFSAYAAANRMRTPRYDPDAHSAHVDQLIAVAPAAFARARADAQAAQAGQHLIFIVGMARSGTSLLEQILGQHPRVSPGGERIALPHLLDQAAARHGVSPAALATTLTDDQVAQLRTAYLRGIAPHAAGHLYTDKLPDNYLRLPIIARLFPAARVLHTTRDAADTCLSCFTQNFGDAQPFSVRLPWLGRRYADYARLMAALEPELPLRHMRVPYERLVGEPEPVIRDVLAFLGLAFEAACLHPEQNPRVVATASFAQVKAPIYRSSIGRAVAYRPWLGELFDALCERDAGPLSAPTATPASHGSGAGGGISARGVTATTASTNTPGSADRESSRGAEDTLSATSLDPGASASD